MTRRPNLGRGPCRNHLHSELLRTQGDVDVDVVDPRVREDPERVATVEGVALHDRVSITFGALEKQELVDSHLAGNPREESQRQLDHRMESDKPSDTRIHLLDWN